MRIEKIVEFLDRTLDTSAFAADSSLNGLQVEGCRETGRVTLAVDACEQSIRRAIRDRSGLLIVHHGLFWGAPEPVTGIMARRLRLLLENGVSLYASHLPLDCHPELGNNARLAEELGIAEKSAFGDYHGIRIGFMGDLPRPMARKSLAAKIRRITASGVNTWPFGPASIRKTGIVSGGGAFLVQAAALEGCQALLTGETSHSSYHAAREHGINLFCAGHYATETFGVKAVGKLLRSELGLQASFADIPTGL